jgi:multicomponent Na+:H+ antiporter subunit C
MEAFPLFALVGALIFVLGLFRLVTHAHLIRKLLALNVMGSGAFLVLIATAHRDRLTTPDPVPQAMVLTGIVVAVSITAFALALTRRIHAVTGDARLSDEIEGGE